MKNSGKILDFLKTLIPLKVPSNISVMYPYRNHYVWSLVEKYYNKYYDDKNKRILIIGINPGRLGGGITGIPFTDPVNLEKYCFINNTIERKREISSQFIYEVINKYGGIEKFNNKYFITSTSPFGFVKNGKNYNYYDEKMIVKTWENQIIKWLKIQINIFRISKKVIILGKGKNQNFIEKINNKYKLFDRLITLPHPRWIMQYKLKIQ